MSLTLDLEPAPPTTLGTVATALTLDVGTDETVYASSALIVDVGPGPNVAVTLDADVDSVTVDVADTPPVFVDTWVGAVTVVGTSTPAIIEIDIGGRQGPPGPPGPAGDPGLVSYQHAEAAASVAWTVVHPLPFRPNVTVVDSAGTVLYADVAYLDDQTIEITFSWPTAGYAYLS